MASPTICTISGQCLKLDGTAFANVTVKANCLRPFIHPTNDALYEDYELSTTTDASGNWSLSLVETTTPNITVTITFYYPGSSNDYKRKEYIIQVPNTATATFQSLIGSQV